MSAVRPAAPLPGDAPPPHGLPGALPAGERLLWQGSPAAWSLATRTFHSRKIAVYFALLLAWCGVAYATGLSSVGATVTGMTILLGLSVAALSFLALISWATARTTVYTITDRRVVLRIGIALPASINIPFKTIQSAGLRCYRDGSGDLPLALNGDGRVAYLHLWPHARPWRLVQPEPMLRAVPDAAAVAAILGTALRAAADQAPVTQPRRPPATAGRPQAVAA